MDPNPTPLPDELQFEKAAVVEARQRPLACGFCQRPLHDVYFEVGGQLSCERCRYDVENERNSGSGVGRFTRALLAGGVAALVGAGLYYAVLALTGYEVGLVAIVVGLLVGFAVRWGSRGRGGWLYQALAMGLTYTAIVSTYVPFIIEEIQKQEASAVVETQAAPAIPETTTGESAPEIHLTAGESELASPEDVPEISLGQAMVALLLFGLLVLAIPFLAGFQNIIGLFIIGIGLYEAWKLNKYQPLLIEGPLQVGKARPSLATGAAGSLTP